MSSVLNSFELEVIGLAADGLDTRAIGQRIGTGPGRVRGYIQEAAKKLEIDRGLGKSVREVLVRWYRDSVDELR